MRIAAARVTPVRLRFVRPVRTARGEFTERSSVLLELRDADGVAGHGEAAPWPGFGMETVQAAIECLHASLAPPGLSEIEPGHWPAALAARVRDAPAARAALQGALWDLSARRAGCPLADRLAATSAAATPASPTRGEVLRRVPVGALLVGREPAAVRTEAAHAREAGYRAVKLKLGGVPFTEDLARARAAREGLGAGLLLRGDANGAWTEAEADAALDALAELNFDYVEQPLPADDFAGLARLRRRAPVRIAADESAATEQGVLRLLADAAVDVIVLKPATVGGPARALEIAASAQRAGLEVVFTHAFESAVGARHVLHCAAAWGDPRAVHGLVTAGLFADDVAPPVAAVGGCADLTTAPGLGVAP